MWVCPIGSKKHVSCVGCFVGCFQRLPKKVEGIGIQTNFSKVKIPVHVYHSSSGLLCLCPEDHTDSMFRLP